LPRARGQDAPGEGNSLIIDRKLQRRDPWIVVQSNIDTITAWEWSQSRISAIVIASSFGRTRTVTMSFERISRRGIQRKSFPPVRS